MIGSTVSHYRILGKLGEGGMGIVYKAQDTRLERLVALKFLPEHAVEGPERKRFLEEARAAAQVHHPNICPIHEIVEDGDRLFFAMALVEGSNLGQLVARGPLPVNDAIDIARQIAGGLQAAHRTGVVHRDIKSNNIAMDRQGNACILDFGIALRGGAERMTRPDRLTGTPAYMSPEQAQGLDVDCRTDIWSLGVVLFEMLTGRLPFRREGDLGVLYAIVNDPPPPVAELRPDTPAEVQRILDKALAKDPAQRYQTAAEMGAALQRVRETRSDATRTLANVAPVPAARGRSRRTLLAAAVVAALLVLAAVFVTARRTAAPAPRNLAVLPLEVIGGDENTRALADGLVESLTSKLTQLEEFEGKLMVIPASEIRSRGISSAAAAQRIYGANLVITGSAQRWGDRLQFTLNLVDTRTMRQTASRTIEFDAANPMALRDAGVASAVGILKIGVSTEASQAMSAGETSTPAAYAQYLVGSGYLARYDVRGNLPRAIASLRDAVELDPKYALAWAALGEAYWRSAASADDARSSELALDAARRAIGLNPRLAAAHITLADIDIGRKRVDEAIAEAALARQLAPSSGAASVALGSAYEAAGRSADAETAYLEAVRRRPSDWYGDLLLGIFYIRQTRYADARRALEEARKLTPDNEVVNRNLAALSMREGRYRDAEKMLQQALKFEPAARSYSTLGLALYYQGRYREAAASLEKALDLSPGTYSFWGNLGTVYRRLPGQKPEEAFHKAIDLAEKALQASPGDHNIHANLAEYYAKLGDRVRALGQIQQIPDAVRGPYMTRIALAYELSGDRARAIETVRTLLRNPASLNEVQHDPDLADLWRDAAFQAAIRPRDSSGK